MNIIVGLIGVILGILILIYRVPIRGFMGQIGWAERYFGPGGTYTALLLIGILLFVLSLMVMTGTLDFLFGGFLKEFFGNVK